jgi:hypothetical protein
MKKRDRFGRGLPICVIRHANNSLNPERPGTWYIVRGWGHVKPNPHIVRVSFFGLFSLLNACSAVSTELPYFSNGVLVF